MRNALSGPALVVLVSGIVLVVLLTMRVRSHERQAVEFFGWVMTHAAGVDRAALLSGETAIGSADLDDHATALRLGDALVRWEVAQNAELSDDELQEVLSQLVYWLKRTDVRGAGAEWAETLVGGEVASPSVSSSARQPVAIDARALRSLRRSLPDGKVEAGRWLAAIKLLAPVEGVELPPAHRSTASTVLDSAELLRVADVRLPALLAKPELTLSERQELGRLAAELLLSKP